MTRTRSRWSKSIGERGHRVRLYEARPGGPIMRSIWINGKEDRKSLGHRDRELATRQAYELLHGVVANVQAIEDESLTLGMLQTLYLASPQHAAKKERTRQNDKQALKRVVGFLGADRNVLSLSESDVMRFTMARRQGDHRTDGASKKGTTVRDRTIELDLLVLSRALNWAQRERNEYGTAAPEGKSVAGNQAPAGKESTPAGDDPHDLPQAARGGRPGSPAAQAGARGGRRDRSADVGVAEPPVG